MQKTNVTKKISIFIALLLVFFTQSILASVSLLSSKSQKVFADSGVSAITISNSNFTNSSDEKLGTPTSFTSQGTQGSTIAGVIDTNPEKFEEYNEENYKLNFNPSYTKTSSDSKVLMINSRENDTRFGYKSSSFTLAENGYYYVSCFVYTQFDEIASRASIYLTNETLDKIDESKIENISTRGSWEEYRFYVKTNSSSQSVSISLYLGSKDNYKSSGAVFFDNLSAYSLTEKEYYNQISTPNANYSRIELTNKDVSISNGILNGDFEDSVSDFTQVPSSTGVSTVGSVYKIVGIGDYYKESDSNINKNPTSANRQNNNYAFLLNNKEKNYIAFESNDILIEQHKNYRLSLFVKTSDFEEDGANITLTQKNPFSSDNYTVATQSFTSINTTSQTNSKANDWILYSFDIKGNVFKDSYATLTLSLGTSTNYVAGYVLFDNIKLEEITSNDYSSSTGSTSKTVDFNSISGSTTISNARFNDVVIESTEDSYPYKANNITVINDSEENFNGIINVNSSKFNSTFPFSNPVSAIDSNADLSYNNIFVLANTELGYQSAESSNFTLTENSYYQVSVLVNTQNLLYSNVSVLLTTDEETIGYVRNINTNNKWELISFVVKTFEDSKTCTLTLNLGTTSENEKGYAFFDDMECSTITEEEYNAFENGKYTKKTNLQNFDLSLKSVTSDSNNFYDALNFNGTLNSSTGTVEAGIINVNEYTLIDANYVVNENVLAIHNISDAYYTLKSNTFTLKSGNYYKITASVRTIYANQDINNQITDEETSEVIPFGATIKLDKLDETFNGIVTENNYETYTFYINATNDITTAFLLSLGDEKALTSGYALFDNLKVETISSNDFTSAVADEKSFVIGSIEIEEDTDNTEDESNETNFDWLVIPTLILAIALLIAMVGLLIRKLNIKFPAKVKVIKDYDRAKTLIKEHERREQLRQREAKLQALREKLVEIENELNETRSQYKNSKALKEEIRNESKKIETQIKQDFKDTTSKDAINKSKQLHLEAKQRIKLERKVKYLAKREELIKKYQEIEKEIEMILEEERLLVAEYKAYKKQLKLQKQEARKNKKK